MARLVFRKAVLAALLPVALIAVPSSPARADEGATATYHGEEIELTKSWEGAGGCWIGDDGNQCFDTVEEMEEAMAASTEGMAARSSCASSLVLYDFNNYGAPALGLTSRGLWLNLSLYGFSAKTSSYTIGACNASFKDAASITYPGGTSAGQSSNAMVVGWNNRITMVFIA